MYLKREPFAQACSLSGSTSFLLNISLTDDWCGRRAQLTRGWTTPGLVVLDAMRKAGSVHGSKPAIGSLLWLLLEFLPWFPSAMDYDLRVVSENKPFPPQAVYSYVSTQQLNPKTSLPTKVLLSLNCLVGAWAILLYHTGSWS